MGAFYGSVHFRSEDRVAVKELLERIASKQKCRFLLGPAFQGWIGAYPWNHGQDERLSQSMTGGFSGELLHLLVHDDDIFAYFFYRDGSLIDQYNSRPDYFEEVSETTKEECRGRPELLAHLLAPGYTPDKLEAILAPDEAEETIFASNLLVRFAELLAIPNAATSYEYLMEGETDDIEGWDDFVHVPDLSEEKAHKREAEASIARVKASMQQEGLLLLEKSGPNGHVSFPVWCPDRAGGGFLVTWNNHMGPGKQCALDRYGPPWSAGPTPSGLMLKTTVHLLALSPSGRYLAASHAAGNWTAQVWDLDTNETIREIRHARCVEWVGFTPDDKLLVAVGTDDGVIITDVKSGRRVATFDIEGARRGAVHPSGTLIVASGVGNLSLVDPISGEVRKTLSAGVRSDAGTLYQALASQAQEQFAQMDIEKMEQDVRATMEKQIKAMEAQVERGAKVPNNFKVEDVIKRLRQSMEEQLARMRQDFDKRKQSASQPVARLLGSESFNFLECSPDGRLLFGATHQGVRVFSWDEIVKAIESTPAPIFSTKAESISASMGSATMGMPGSIYGVAHDAASNRLLFGGLEGKIGFLDLVSGKSGTLLHPPGRAPIISLGLSRDRGSLCCALQPAFFARGKERNPPLLQIWNYAALARQLGGLH